ncbi:L,D-transpeptidase family protein [Brevundimonas sp. 2R-24]|uniref:L,D-transpeptidase family protein n=1 Tax=Peiella sedimenti TaxID=3061083 RepID=A0ABT8SKS5_9CAUL|nr:L,D-transpeptidase family protein [Caulobacteraceae bacterium XZ-24]
MALTLGAAATAVSAACAQAQPSGQNQRQSTYPTPPSNGTLPQAAAISRAPAALRADLTRIYEATGGRPLWTGPLAQSLAAAVSQAYRHGLDPQAYGGDRLLNGSASDVDLTVAALNYAKVLSEGSVDPTTVEDLWEMRRNSADLASGLLSATSQNRVGDWLESLAPDDIGYRNLSEGYVRYRQIAERGGWPTFRQGGKIEPGQSDPRLPAIKARLLAEGDLSPADELSLSGEGDLYGPTLERGVRAFQLRHGLLVDGIIGEGTQSALSASAMDRARQIALNLERRRWLARDVAPERIEVNTAAAIMVYWKDARPVHSNRVIVGTARNQTPSLEKPFASVVANPPWYVPMSIARSEILPRGPGYLRNNNMYVVDGRVIQRASPSSALGLVKFELVDSYAIFLHDTPTKPLFRHAFRHRSHGCVRVENAVEFARLLLSPDPERLARFDAALDSRNTTRVDTGRSISVRLLYWTAFVTGQGAVAFREDVYQRDQRLAEALGIAVNLPRAVDDGRNDPADVGP